MGRPGVVVQIKQGIKVKICPNCKRELALVFFSPDKTKTDGVTSFCKECREIRRKMRATFGLTIKKRRYENPIRWRARAIVRRLVNLGLKKLEACQVCGAKGKTEAHHPDYSNPYDFVWLCKTCHMLVHRRK